MYLDGADLSPAWLVAGHLAFWPALAWAAWRAPWRPDARPAPAVAITAALAVAVIWRLAAGAGDGPRLHLLGATLLTLMLGAPRAVLALGAVSLSMTAAGLGDLAAAGSNGCLNVLLPVGLAAVAHRASRRWLPRHLFIYFFADGFFTAGATLTLVLLTGAWLTGQATALQGLVLALPEAFLTGTLLTLFVVYKPQWVGSFDDREYLGRR